MGKFSKGFRVRPTTLLFVARVTGDERRRTQHEVSEESGINVATISLAETRSAKMSIEIQRKFARYYKKEVSYFFDENGFSRIKA